MPKKASKESAESEDLVSDQVVTKRTKSAKMDEDEEKDITAVETTKQSRPKKRSKSEPSSEDHEAQEANNDIVEKSSDTSSKKRSKSSKDEDTERDVAEVADEPESLTVYLTGFPYDVDIAKYVREHSKGVIDVRVHTWHDTGKSRGCAHVDYGTPDDLKAAIKKLHKATVGTRYIEAVKANDSGAANVAPPVGDDASRGGRRLFVKNLPYDVTEDAMKTFFQKFGAVTHVRIPQWNHTENKKGFGYVQFEQKAFAVECMKTHRETPFSMSGRTLKLDYDQGRPKRGFKDEQGRAWYKPKTAAGGRKQGGRKAN